MRKKALIKKLYLFLTDFHVFNWIPDVPFLKIQYRVATGKKLNLADPKLFNEKIQWIKVYDHNAIYTILADKYKVRDYVAEKVGSDYLIPLIGVWENVDDIDFSKMPKQFVLKNNHDSGGVYICRDKDFFDFNKIALEIKKRMEKNYFFVSREWAYKNVSPCVIAEKLLVDEKISDLRDYKFFCFNGKPMFVQVDFDRFHNHRRNIYDINWNMLDLTIKCPSDKAVAISKPKKFEEMIFVARKLSEGIPLLRVDLYEVNEKVFFGETTLYHGGGFEKFTPNKYEIEWGNLINLDCIKTVTV